MQKYRIYRTYLSEREWSEAQLKDYNIEINNVNANTFFNQSIEDVTLDEVPESILKCITSKDIIDDEDPGYDFLRFHDILMSGGLENTVNNFTKELLRILKFRGSRRIITTCQHIPLTMCGTYTIVETDVCVQNNDNPEPQLVAKAIATFQYNNKIRRRHLRKEELTSYIFPCITMVGSYARFYKIPITQELNLSVIDGYKPILKTEIQCFDPLEKDLINVLGMTQLQNRKKILQCFKLMREIMLKQAELLI